MLVESIVVITINQSTASLLLLFLSGRERMIGFLLHVCDVSFQQTPLTKRGHILLNRHCFFPHCIELNPLINLNTTLSRLQACKKKKKKKVCLIPWHNHVYDYDVFKTHCQSIWTRLSESHELLDFTTTTATLKATAEST